MSSSRTFLSSDVESQHSQQRANSNCSGKNTWKRVLCILGLVSVLGLFMAAVLPSLRYREVGPMVRVSSIPKDRRIHPDSDKRIIVMGDVHGMYKPMRKLLHKLEFDPDRDQLIFTGDFTTKGPDSIKILDKAIEWNAACVRGNHEDDILRLYANHRKLNVPQTYPPHASKTVHVWGDAPQATLAPTEGPNVIPPRHPHAVQDFGADGTQEKLIKRDENENDTDPLENEERDIRLVRKLKNRHIKYLERCPAIMELGKITEDGEHAVVVHGGLEWQVEQLEEQLPEVVLRIRDLLPKDYTEPIERPTDDSRPWFKLWNKVQAERPKSAQLEVVYGHAASMGLQIHDFTLGLDSKCQRGEQLSAMVFSTNKKGKYRKRLYQVNC